MGADFRNPLPLTGIVLLGVLTLAWGFNWPAMKLGLSEVGPWTFRTFCLLTGGIGLLAIARAGGQSLKIPHPEQWPLCVVALFNITGWHMFSAYGLTLTGAGRAVIIAFTMPLWAVILESAVFRVPLSAARSVALLLGLAGLAILIGPEVRVFWKAPTGALFMLCAAVSWGTGTVLVKRFRWTISTVLLTGWQVTLGAVPVMVGKFVLESLPPLASLSLKAVIGTAYATVIGVLFCHYSAVRKLGYHAPAPLRSRGRPPRLQRNIASARPSPRALPRGADRRPSRTLPADCAVCSELSPEFCTAQYVWFKVVQMLPSSIAAIGALGIPVVGVFSSGLVLGEPVGLRELAALGLVVPALALLLLRPHVPAMARRQREE